jgi:hypothetical protein
MVRPGRPHVAGRKSSLGGLVSYQVDCAGVFQLNNCRLLSDTYKNRNKSSRRPFRLRTGLKTVPVLNIGLLRPCVFQYSRLNRNILPAGEDLHLLRRWCHQVGHGRRAELPSTESRRR